MPEARISVVINTLNEERNLSYALRSVRPWVDQIVVVDMHSSDRTVEVAKGFGAEVHFHEPLGFADPARSFAVSKATGDWILMLDADELVPEPLSRKLREVARDTTGVDAVRIPWLNYLLGSPVLHSGWGPHQDKHVRFFKRGFVNADSAIHDFLKPKTGARILDLPFEPGWFIVHFNYVDVAHFIEKLNRYTTIEAEQAKARGDQPRLLSGLAAAGNEFVRRYIRATGYKDGWRGFYLSAFMAFYRLAAAAKLRELRSLGPRERVVDKYRAEAESLLAVYDNTSLNSKRVAPFGR